jgi:hypothetical protein
MVRLLPFLSAGSSHVAGTFGTAVFYAANVVYAVAPAWRCIDAGVMSNAWRCLAVWGWCGSLC